MTAPSRLTTALFFAAASGGVHAAPALTLDLAALPTGAKVTRIFGRGLPNDGFLGVPVCGGHDCDGDGHRDFAFAQFRGDPLGRTGAGEVTLAFGDGTIGWSADSAVPQAGILRIAGAQPYEAAGAEIWIDDVTGDGLGDLLIGRQNYSLEFAPPEAPRVGCGGLTIVVGSAAWKTHAATLSYLDLAAPPPGVQVLTFAGPAAYDRLGIWMRTGDIDGDRVADILVGADEVDGEGELLGHNQGAAFVIRGGAHLLDAPEVVDLAAFGETGFAEALKGHVAWIDPPEGSAGYHFGATVQVGDLDGNRRAEVMVAATLNRSGAGVRLPGAPSGTGSSFGGSPDGTLYIVWDENFPPGPWPESHRFAATAPPFGQYSAIDGDTAAVSFGEEILGGLDYSGDGFADLMVGDLVADPLGRNNAGRGYIFYNSGNLRGLDFDLDLAAPPPGVSVTTVIGSLANSISSDTALHGDFDGDGIGDLAIGSPHDRFFGRSDAGTVHVFYGQPGGWPPSIDLAPSVLPAPGVMRIALVGGAHGTSGSDRGDVLCYSAAPGDIDGDGRADLIVNEMAGDGFGGSPDDVGNLIVIDSAALLAAPQPSLSLGPAGPLDFGSVSVEGGSATETITIANNGAAPVTIQSLAVDGPAMAEFTIATDSGEAILAPGEFRSVTLTYDPAHEGRSGAALRLSTDADSHPLALGLAGRGVSEALAVPGRVFWVTGPHAVMEVQSQFGTDYTLTRDAGLDIPDPPGLFTVPGNGQTLYLTDPRALDMLPRAFYRIRVDRK